jgi:hypothetical protein
MVADEHLRPSAAIGGSKRFLVWLSGVARPIGAQEAGPFAS